MLDFVLWFKDSLSKNKERWKDNLVLNTRGSERKIVNTKLKQMTDHKICLAFENMHDCCHRVQGFCTSKHPQTSLWTVFTHLLLHTGPHSQKLKDHVVPVLHLLLSFSSSCGSKGSVICYCYLLLQPSSLSLPEEEVCRFRLSFTKVFLFCILQVFRFTATSLISQ